MKVTISAKRQLLGVIAGVMCLFPLGALAVGLGNIETQTHLGDRLLAEIPIKLGSEDLAADELYPSLMSVEEAAERGLELLTPRYQFKLAVKEQGGQLMLLITTERPVTEPFINLLVKLDWPTGSLAREYTMMFDHR